MTTVLNHISDHQNCLRQVSERNPHRCMLTSIFEIVGVLDYFNIKELSCRSFHMLPIFKL